MPDNGIGLFYLCNTKGIGITYFEFTMRFPNENKARDFIIATVRLKIDHTICYSLGNGIHTNGIESFWSIIKRGIYGVFHNVSVKHLQNYVNEFCFRLNYRDYDVAFEKIMELAVA